MDLIWNVVIFILACLMIVKPEIIWRIERLFAPSDEKPNDTYLKISRVGGFCIILYVVFKTFMG